MRHGVIVPLVGLASVSIAAMPLRADELVPSEQYSVDVKATKACLKTDERSGLGCIGVEFIKCAAMDAGAPNSVQQTSWCSSSEIDPWHAGLDGKVTELTAMLKGRVLAAFLAQQAAYQTCAENAFAFDLTMPSFPYRYGRTDRSLPIIAVRAIETDFIVSEVPACLDPDANMRLDEVCPEVRRAP